MKLTKAVEGFIFSMKADGFSDNTLGVYEWALNLLGGYLNDKSVEKIVEKDLQKFMVWLRQDYQPKRMNGNISPLAPASVENIWIATRSFFNWAEIEFKLKNRPDRRLKRPRYKPRQISPLTQEEIIKLLGAAERTKKATTSARTPFTMQRPTAKRDVAIILLLLDTGLRVSELARLKIFDANIEDGIIQVLPFGTGQKTEPRKVYFGAAARKSLWRYLAQSESPPIDDQPLLLSIRGKAMNRNSIRIMLSRLGKKAGIKGVHPHRLRHTFAIQFLRNRGSVFELQELLGHATLEMVKHYAKLANLDIQPAHRRASPADRWDL